ncbi:hypothetical protein DRE_05216 [Drechslerella stenobrocha 248]|uniref:CFEM domain-containing protein n=1 Tax=Drechslerella stenobrocha 248 TaxID=1043628 RepID=W7I9D4_9PEZI|nr:hypothetical protein DRE_05216 [Drechslerella stenobrocha 248]
MITRHSWAFALAFVLALKMAHAQVSVALPLCAVDCRAEALLQSSCFQTDARCLCISRGYMESATECVRRVCNDADREQAEQYAVENCRANGIAISLPPLSSSATRSATAPASATRTGQATTSASGASATAPGASRTQSGSTTSTGGAGPSDTAVGASDSVGGSSTNVGAIAGGVVGGVVAVAAIILGIWLYKREQRKKMGMLAPLPPGVEVQPDPDSQGIWTGENAYSWNPRKEARDVQGGVPDR